MALSTPILVFEEKQPPTNDYARSTSSVHLDESASRPSETAFYGWLTYRITEVKKTHESLNWSNPNTDIRIAWEYLDGTRDDVVSLDCGDVDYETETIKINRYDVGDPLSIEGRLGYSGCHNAVDGPYTWLIIYEYDWYSSRKTFQLVNSNGSYSSATMKLRTKSTSRIYFSNSTGNTLLSDPGCAGAAYSIENSWISFDLQYWYWRG